MAQTGQLLTFELSSVAKGPERLAGPGGSARGPASVLVRSASLMPARIEGVARDKPD